MRWVTRVAPEAHKANGAATPTCNTPFGQDLLGHKSSRMTTHYGAADLGNLLSAANLATKSRESPARTCCMLSEDGVTD